MKQNKFDVASVRDNFYLNSKIIWLEADWQKHLSFAHTCGVERGRGGAVPGAESSILTSKIYILMAPKRWETLEPVGIFTTICF